MSTHGSMATCPMHCTPATSPGAVVAVVKDGQILTERGYGYSDVAKRTPVDPKLTLFRPGSVSKLFTWTAVMQLVEQGKIDLDADVNQYLDFKIPARDGKPITMRNLMQHIAGLRGAGQGHHVRRPQVAGLRGAAQAMGAGAGFRRRHHAGVFQLRRLARRLHRAARSRASPSTTTSTSTSSSRSTCSTRPSASRCRRISRR